MFKTFQVFTNADCNLRCKYCYEYLKNRGKNNPETIKKYISTILANKNVQSDIKNISIEFIGGESFLYPKEMKEYIEFILQVCEYYKLNDIPHISTNTNGTLLGSDDVKNLISTYGRYLSIGVSIDGTKECHDLNRVDIHGNGSYDRIIENLDFTRKHISKNKLNVKATFNHNTIKYYKDSILNLINLGFTKITANTVYEELWTDDDTKLIFDQIKDIVDYLVDHDLEDKILIEQINKNGSDYKSLALGLPKDSNHCGTCEHMVCLGFDNKIYGCHRFATNFIYPIGNIDSNSNICIDNIEFIDNIKAQYLNYPKECFNCNFSQLCGTCATLPYELNISAKDFFKQKRQCGFTKAIGYGICYFGLKIEEKKRKTSIKI